MLHLTNGSEGEGRARRSVGSRRSEASAHTTRSQVPEDTRGHSRCPAATPATRHPPAAPPEETRAPPPSCPPPLPAPAAYPARPPPLSPGAPSRDTGSSQAVEATPESLWSPDTPPEHNGTSKALPTRPPSLAPHRTAGATAAPAPLRTAPPLPGEPPRTSIRLAAGAVSLDQPRPLPLPALGGGLLAG